MTALDWRCLEIGCGAGALLLLCRFLGRLHDEAIDAPRRQALVKREGVKS